MSDDITPAPMSKSEAWDLTDNIRTDLETAYDAIQRAKVNIPIARERRAWEAMGYESMEEYIEEEFGEALGQLKIKVDDRMELVNVLSDSGMSNRQIAGTLGVNERTVRRDLAASQDEGAANAASNEVDTRVIAGQSVEHVGHIDDDGGSLQIVEMRETTRDEEVQESSNDNIEETKERLDSWLDEIDFSKMILPTQNQIIEPEATQETEELFTPRPVAPSWSPPQVQELPPPPVKRYDDPQPEFLAPAMKLEKVRDPNQDSTKHCRTCNCNLLP